MKITLVSRCYPPHSGYGGIAVYSYYLARALAKQGHTINVVAARFSPEIPEETVDEGVRVIRILVKHRSFFQRVPFFGKFYRPVQRFFYSLKVSSILAGIDKNQKQDIVEFPEIEAEGFCYLLRKKRARVIVRCHTPTFVLKKYYNQEEVFYDTFFMGLMETFCIRKADLLSAPSHDMAATIALECGIPENQIRVIPNGLGPELFVDGGKNRDPKELLVLHVGRLDRLKGVEVLAQAIPLVLKENPETRFVFIGQSISDAKGVNWKRRLEAYLAERKSMDKVQFLEHLDQSAMLQWYTRADIAVVPSILYESFSYTCAQAMAAGLPLVATRIGGIPETLGEDSAGILVKAGDAQALADGILKFAKNPEMRLEAGRKARKRAEEKFSQEKILPDYLAYCAEEDFQKHHTSSVSKISEKGKKAVILAYHEVGEEKGSPFPSIYVVLENFKRQINALKRLGYKFISMDEFISGLQGKTKLPKYSAVITFDDGYEGVYKNAFPFLRSQNLPATVYAIADKVETRENTSFPYLSAEQLKEMAGCGISIGSHSFSHADLKQCSGEILRREISDSKKKLEEITGTEVRHFCYPFGSFNHKTADLVAGEGYQSAVSTLFGSRHRVSDIFHLKRVSVGYRWSLPYFLYKVHQSRSRP